MKKIYYIYLLSGLFFVTILSTSTLSQGWSNGQNMVGAVNPINEPIYIQLYHTDYDTYIPGTRNTYYGTHDWIAESVLELLYLYNPGNSFITSLKNNEDYMKMYYLVGTEYPDMQPRYNFELVTRCGFVIELTSSSEAPSSKIRWDSISGIPTIDYLGTGVQLMYQQIQQAFLARDCQRAAFYLGALMHYIGDASYYGHMIDGVEWRVIYQHISYITEKLWYARTSTDFFLTDEAKARLTAFSNPTQFLIQPQAAAWMVSQDTFFGDGFYEDTHFLWYHEPFFYDRGFWGDIDGYWTGYSQELEWTYSDRPIGGDSGMYFDTLEHNLNMAILYGYAALNYAITYGGYTGCDCLGDGDGRFPDQNPPNQQPVGVGTTLNMYLWLFFFNSVGYIAALVALTFIPKSLEQLTKLVSGIPF